MTPTTYPEAFDTDYDAWLDAQADAWLEDLNEERFAARFDPEDLARREEAAREALGLDQPDLEDEWWHQVGQFLEAEEFLADCTWCMVGELGLEAVVDMYGLPDCPDCNPDYVPGCPDCEGDFVPGCPDCQPRRVRGHVTDTPCDPRCLHAKGDECWCSCGGANHGMGSTLRILPGSLVRR